VLETPHVVVAAAIATKISNPIVSLPLAFASHFLLETIPHWNPHLNSEIKLKGKISNLSKTIISFDVFTSLLSGFFIASLSLPDNLKFLTIVLACFVATLPDLIEAPYYLAGKEINFLIKRWIPFKKFLQSDTSLFWGTLNQILIIAVSFWWILG